MDALGNLIDSLHGNLEEFKKMVTDPIYKERNALVAFLTHLYPSWLSIDPDEDEKEWRWVVFICGPAGQMSWHIHELDLPIFEHLKKEPNKWDGHTAEEKYLRLVDAGLLLERAKK